MSKLAELLVSRGVVPGPANPANPANREGWISSFSKISRGSGPELSFTPDLERRIHAMAVRWNYPPDDYLDVMQRAKRNPASWVQAVALDEEREAEFCERGLTPRTDA